MVLPRLQEIQEKGMRFYIRCKAYEMVTESPSFAISLATNMALAHKGVARIYDTKESGEVPCFAVDQRLRYEGVVWQSKDCPI